MRVTTLLLALFALALLVDAAVFAGEKQADRAAAHNPREGRTMSETQTKEKKAKTPKRKTEADLAAKYAGISPGTLQFDVDGKYQGKQTVLRECANDRDVDAHTFRIATSDLWQKDACDACTDHRRKERAKAKRATKRAEKDAETVEAEKAA